MATSGIAEHNEARRIQQRKDLKAALRMKMLEDSQAMSGDMGGSSYDNEIEHLRKLGSPPGIPGHSRHDPVAVDRRRRNEIYSTQQVEYSAKLSNRFNSTDYKSQW